MSNQGIIKDITLNLDINARKRVEGKVDIKLYSKDIATGQFEFTFIDEDGETVVLDETYSAQALVKYEDEEKTYLDDMTIEGNIIRFIFPHDFITKDGIVTMYIYITKDSYTSDVAAISFNVYRSEIDDVATDIVATYDKNYEDILVEFKQALEDYKLTLPKADSVRAEIDDILNQFSVDSQAKLSQFDTDAQQLISDNQVAFNLAESIRQEDFDTSQSEKQQQFDNAQTTRQESYDQTQSLINEAELLRVEAEGNRDSAETIRKANEYNRAQAEDERQTNETERQATFETNESERDETFNANETTRQENETLRQEAETQRASEESNRVNAEVKRVRAENERQISFEDSESVRLESFQIKEAGRQSQFNDAEQSRQTTFETGETSRQNSFEANESNRVQAEDERESAEAQRKIDHANRSAEFDGKADKKQEDWITPTLLNGATGSLKYRKNSLGKLEFKGTLLLNNTSKIANIPRDCAPMENAFFIVPSTALQNYKVAKLDYTGGLYFQPPVLSTGFEVEFNGVVISLD